MRPWVLRGLRHGVVTTAYPRRSDGYGPGFRAGVRLVGQDTQARGDELAPLCPTGAIGSAEGGALALDRGRCIACGHCVRARPDLFAFDPGPEVASVSRAALIQPERAGPRELEQARAALARRVRALRRSVHVRHLDTGSDGSEEWEVHALLNPVYDIARLGVQFTASPRHADLLLVTGVGAASMREPLQRTFEAMPEPKVVVAAGTDALSGGLFSTTSTSGGGVDQLVPVDVFVPGSPPSPLALLHGILVAVGKLGGVR